MDVTEAIRRRRSVREYRGDPIPAEVFERVTDALRLAPSACNYQPWRFILVFDPDRRIALADACHRQMFIAEAPVIVCACALPQAAYKRMGGTWNSADVDVAIAVDQLTLAAAAEGLGTCWIGAFDDGRVRDLLKIPPEAKVVALTPLGYPGDPGLLRPIQPGDRRSRSEVFKIERW
jgi:nitroreductase